MDKREQVQWWKACRSWSIFSLHTQLYTHIYCVCISMCMCIRRSRHRPSKLFPLTLFLLSLPPSLWPGSLAELSRGDIGRGKGKRCQNRSGYLRVPRQKKRVLTVIRLSSLSQAGFKCQSLSQLLTLCDRSNCRSDHIGESTTDFCVCPAATRQQRWQSTSQQVSFNLRTLGRSSSSQRRLFIDPKLQIHRVVRYGARSRGCDWDTHKPTCGCTVMQLCGRSRQWSCSACGAGDRSETGWMAGGSASDWRRSTASPSSSSSLRRSTEPSLENGRRGSEGEWQ